MPLLDSCHAPYSLMLMPAWLPVAGI